MDDIFDDETQQEIIENGENGEAIGTENSAEIDVLAPSEQGDKGGAIRRNEKGQWIKGHAPPAPMRKRKPKQDEQELVVALREALPADKVKELLDKAIDFAIVWKSHKGILDIVRLRLEYGLGMPVQRSITASTKLETILSRLGEMDDSEFSEVEQQMRSE